MMEMEKDTYIIDLQLCLVHDGRNNENETREETKLVVGSEADFSVVENSHSSQERMAEKEKKSKKKDFPSRLHEMLHESKAQGREHIISWDPDGKSFTVHQPEDFLAEVMPNYFKQTKYRSFQRMVSAIAQ